MASNLTAPTFPLHARMLNGLDRALRRLGIRCLTFEPAALMRAAVRQTGLDDFDDDPVFREGLEVLCASVEADADLTLVGRTIIRAYVLRTLVTRLRAVDLRERAPEIAETALVPPLIVLGLPRSGTTLMHHLLTRDPVARPLLFWELMEPIAGPGPDRRAETLREMLDGMKRAEGGLDAKHAFDADNPEECMLLLDSTLVSLSFWVFAPVYGYGDWLRRQDQRGPYRTYRWFLQYFQSADPGRRLTLKAPAHSQALGALLDAVPDARIVQMHRDPVDVVPSLNSLIHSLHGLVTREVDVRRMSEANMTQLECFIERIDAARAARPGRVLDVRYDELIGDPVACARRVYDHFGLELTAQTVDAMKAHVVARPQHAHGRHVYAAEDFGLDPAAIAERFAGYRARYLPPSGR